jgi:hypothetical protein
VNLLYDDKFTTLVTNVRTEGSGKAVAVGGFSTPLEPGGYSFQAISGAFGGVIASLKITVVSSLPPAQPSTLPEQSSLPPAVSSAPSGLSEQPDTAAFQKYFSELGIGKMPADVKNPPLDLKKNVNVFSAGDQICLYGTTIQECQIHTTLYDLGARKVIREGGLPRPMMGGFAGWEPVTLPAGKYEYKVYVGDALVGVFPFEVR